MSGDGGVYIKKLIEDGALVEDFKTELLGIYPLKECQKREEELAMTSLFPKGLNGNAGSLIVMTEEVRAKIRAAKQNISPETRAKLSAALKRKDSFRRN